MSTSSSVAGSRPYQQLVAPRLHLRGAQGVCGAPVRCLFLRRSRAGRPPSPWDSAGYVGHHSDPHRGRTAAPRLRTGTPAADWGVDRSRALPEAPRPSVLRLLARHPGVPHKPPSREVAPDEPPCEVGTHVAGSGDTGEGVRSARKSVDVGVIPDSSSASAVIPLPSGIGSAASTRTHSGPDVSRPS